MSVWKIGMGCAEWLVEVGCRGGLRGFGVGWRWAFPFHSELMPTPYNMSLNYRMPVCT